MSNTITVAGIPVRVVRKAIQNLASAKWKPHPLFANPDFRDGKVLIDKKLRRRPFWTLVRLNYPLTGVALLG